MGMRQPAYAKRSRRADGEEHGLWSWVPSSNPLLLVAQPWVSYLTLQGVYLLAVFEMGVKIVSSYRRLVMRIKWLVKPGE